MQIAWIQTQNYSQITQPQVTSHVFFGKKHTFEEKLNNLK